MTRSWARRSFAAATIFMALVICCVFLMLTIFLRMSRKLAIVSSYSKFKKEYSIANCPFES
jgi:hypothetical protein